MGRSLKTVMDSLPEGRRRKIETRYRELVTEVEDLKSLRKELGLSQEKIAAALDKSQAAVSKIENGSDMLLSTIRTYVEALGYELDLVVHAPRRRPVRLSLLSDLIDDDRIDRSKVDAA